MLWKQLLALGTIGLGYGAAYHLVGGLAPDHRKLVNAILTRHVLEAAQTLLRPT